MRLPRQACTQVWNKVNHGLIKGGNGVGDVVDGNVASKAEDIGDSGGMTCGGEFSGGGVEYAGDMKV